MSESKSEEKDDADGAKAESKSNDFDLFDQVSKFCMSGTFESDFEEFAE